MLYKRKSNFHIVKTTTTTDETRQNKKKKSFYLMIASYICSKIARNQYMSNQQKC